MFYITRGTNEFLSLVDVGDRGFMWAQDPRNGWMDGYLFEETEEDWAIGFCERNPGARMVWVD